MQLIGGALVTPLMGWVSDVAGSINAAYAVPALCYLVVARYAQQAARREAAAAAALVRGETS